MAILKQRDYYKVSNVDLNIDQANNRCAWH